MMNGNILMIKRIRRVDDTIARWDEEKISLLVRDNNNLQVLGYDPMRRNFCLFDAYEDLHLFPLVLRNGDVDRCCGPFHDNTGVNNVFGKPLGSTVLINYGLILQRWLDVCSGLRNTMHPDEQRFVIEFYQEYHHKFFPGGQQLPTHVLRWTQDVSKKRM